MNSVYMKQKYDELEKLYQEKLYNKIYRKIKSTINRKNIVFNKNVGDGLFSLFFYFNYIFF